MHVNLVHWNSLHPKKAIIPNFCGQTLNFFGKNHKTRIIKLGLLRSFGAEGLGSNIYKKLCNTFYNAVAVEYTLYLARPQSKVTI